MQIELVVIRNVAASSSISDGLFKWLTEVVTEACDERRNVRVRIICIFLLNLVSNILYSLNTLAICLSLASIQVPVMPVS